MVYKRENEINLKGKFISYFRICNHHTKLIIVAMANDTSEI